MSVVHILRDALAQWRCPSCGGSGYYLRDERARRLVNPEKPTVQCKTCNGDGLHPTASAALDRVAAL